MQDFATRMMLKKFNMLSISLTMMKFSLQPAPAHLLNHGYTAFISAECFMKLFIIYSHCWLDSSLVQWNIKKVLNDTHHIQDTSHHMLTTMALYIIIKL